MAASANPICIGGAVTLTTSASTATWNTGSNATSITVSPTVTTTYSVVGTGSANCLAIREITITVQPLPVISTVNNPSLLCVGSTATVSASGAATYTWAAGTGSNSLFSPTVSTTYTVSGSSVFGCVSSKTFAVNVNTNTMGISASSSTVCAGSPALLTITGVNSYTWSNGSHFQTLPIAPTTNTTYFATGRDANFCQLNNSITISVNPKPNVVANADRNVICKGETTTLTANGASTYVWNGNGSGSTLIVTLPVDVTYTYMVVGTDSKGCSDTAIVSVAVSRCTGIDKNNQGSVSTVLYPNPNNGEFVIESAATVSLIEVSDVTGRVIFSRKADGYTNNLSLKEYSAGVYYVRIQTADKTEVIKMIKE
ncbi:MAG: T9SS type A sorting domain-containing protein [Bacteroidia bacterium]|nr:T9SS type A sorting domain-containing protein [Bacteroidia bacterium]